MKMAKGCARPRKEAPKEAKEAPKRGAVKAGAPKKKA